MSNLKELLKFYIRENPYDFMVNIFLALMFAIFPLFFTNQYSNIRHDKYYFFLGSAAVLLIGMVIIFLAIDNGRDKDNPKNYFNKKYIRENISSTDIFFFGFIICSCISTIFAYDKTNALTGWSSRNSGLLTLILYFIVYLVISRSKNIMNVVLWCFGIISALVCLLGIVNYFYIDPLGMFKNYAMKYVLDFATTIGNKNLFSAFCSLSVPFAFTMYTVTKSKWRSIFLLIGTIDFVGLLCSDSDSGIFGIVAFFGIALLFYIRNIKLLKDYFLSLCCMMTGSIIFSLIIRYSPLAYKGKDALISMFTGGNLAVYLLLIFGAIYVGLLFVRTKSTKNILPKYVFFIYAGLLVAGFLLICYGIIYYSIINTSVNVDISYARYLRLSDSWGSHRGWIWHRAVDMFLGGDIFRRLFGYGPDSFGVAMDSFGYNSTMSVLYGESTNCAHNEYLNYLITNGAAGMISYIGILVCTIKRGISVLKEKPTVAIFMLTIICYSIQAIANIAQPITTPLFIIMIGLCEQKIRHI